MAEQRKIGFIGLGDMGGGMAAQLLAAGHQVLGHDLSAERTAAFEARGGRVCGDVRELAEEADAVFLSVPGPPETEQILLGADGLLAKMRAGTAVVNTSTVGRELMVEVAAKGAERGIDVLDAPVTGAADGAAAGTLTFMVGAEADALERWRELLEPLSSVVIHTGPPGTGTAAKLLTNLLWFTHVVALCDTLAAAVKSGITPAVMSELIPVSAADSWVADHDLPNLLAGDDDESFSLALCCKDLRLIRELSDAVGAPVTLLDGVENQFQTASRTFGPSAGELAVSRLSEAAAEVSIRADGDPVAGTAQAAT